MFQIDSYHTINHRDPSLVKKAIYCLMPIIIGMKVYPDLYQYSGFGNYVHNPADTSNFQGNHAMLVVGYDDQRQAYKVMNSWGEGWGDKGFLWISYDTFAALVNEAYTIYRRADYKYDHLDPSPFAISGSVGAVAGSYGLSRDADANLTGVSFYYRLDSFLRMDKYELYYYPDIKQFTARKIGEYAAQVSARGGVVEFAFYDEEYLRSHQNGYFVLRMTGRSKYNEAINLYVPVQMGSGTQR